MTTAAWIFLGTTWTIILVITGYCFTKLLTSERQFDREAEGPPTEDPS